MRKNLKVLHLLNELKFSGAEMLLHSSSEYMNEFGDHYILSTGDTAGEYAPYLTDRGYNVIHAPFSKSLDYFLRFHRVIREHRFDIVHIHAERAAFWHSVVARLAGSQCIRTIHNTFLFEGGLRTRKSLERRLLGPLGIRHIACSTRVAENELTRFGLKSQVIQNWFDPARITLKSEKERVLLREKWRVPPSAFLICSIGNSGPAKNHEAIIDAVRLCGDDLNLHYILCGSPSDSVLARAKGASSGRIRLLGPVSQIDEILAIADAFVCTSLFEGGQISLLEAGAAGCVCVTTNVGLANEFADEPGVRFIEPNGKSLAEALRNLIATDVDVRKADGRRLALKVRTAYTPDVGAAAYKRIYASLLGRL